MTRLGETCDRGIVLGGVGVLCGAPVSLDYCPAQAPDCPRFRAKENVVPIYDAKGEPVGRRKPTWPDLERLRAIGQELDDMRDALQVHEVAGGSQYRWLTIDSLRTASAAVWNAVMWMDRTSTREKEGRE